MNIIPFEGKTLPAYLKKFDIAALNADLTTHAGAGFPSLSIKGKNFAVVRDGERTTLMNPKDPESPATYIDVVILKANRDKSKVFYLKGYDPKESEGQKPDCYSSDGVAPAADSTAPQAKKCATCPHNQWGSRITEKGASKGKACNDTVRLAVAAAGQINDPMLLRVPPASIKAVGEYGQMLAKRGVGYNMVVTKVAFDSDAESPKLTFKPVGLLDDASFAEVQETIESDIVANIIGANLNQVIEHVAAADARDAAAAEEAAVVAQRVVSRARQVSDAEVESAVAAAEPEAAPTRPKAQAAKAAPKPAPKPAPEADSLDVDLEGIDFDD